MTFPYPQLSTLYLPNLAYQQRLYTKPLHQHLHRTFPYEGHYGSQSSALTYFKLLKINLLNKFITTQPHKYSIFQLAPLVIHPDPSQNNPLNLQLNLLNKVNHMNTSAYIELALKQLGCTQKELAARLSVSTTQISKWKKGEYISADMREKIKKLLAIDDYEPEFILLTHGLEQAQKWDKLIHYLADLAQQGAETGYKTIPLHDELNILNWQTLSTLKKMGVDLPQQFPIELDINYDPENEEEFETVIEIISTNPYSVLINNIFESLNDVYGFYNAYIYDYIYDDDLDLESTEACNIEDRLLELAASKLDKSPLCSALNFENFKFITKNTYADWINIVKDKAFRAGIPLRAELMNLVYSSHDEIGHEAEAENLGFNKNNIHPDIYMNELLVGMRMIHQVLPAILKKLEINDFEIDGSDLRMRK
ncbi:helix-turn-helix protein [Acinetobacter calcoaceticus]|uniref:Helix-turn-helix protein n=1 Tax=Acinetobacter calcoaceticus TaxID=471 RepID=A0A4V2R187_ACICA|nr:helix-turn-helix protein [Acinetobacter calcoaceticus]